GDQLPRHRLQRADVDQACFWVRGEDSRADHADVRRERHHGQHGGHDAEEAEAERQERLEEAPAPDVAAAQAARGFTYSKSAGMPLIPLAGAAIHEATLPRPVTGCMSDFT